MNDFWVLTIAPQDAVSSIQIVVKLSPDREPIWTSLTLFLYLSIPFVSNSDVSNDIVSVAELTQHRMTLRNNHEWGVGTDF
jgi:hypothetical protein